MEHEPSPQDDERQARELARRLLTTPHKPQKSEPKRLRQKDGGVSPGPSASRPEPPPLRREG